MEANTMIMRYLFLLLLFPVFVQAKTIVLTPDANGGIYYADATTLNYAPGDTIRVKQNAVGWYMANVVGLPGKYVVITTDPGVIIGGGSSRNFEMYSSKYVKVINMYSDGANNPTRTKNAKFNYKFQFCSDMWFENLYGKNGSDGLSCKSDPDSNNVSSQYPNQIIRNIVAIDCTMDSTNNEGFYFGNTMTGKYACPNNRPAPIYGLYIKNCKARWTGWDGIQITLAYNVFLDGFTGLRNGLANEGGQSQGATIQDNTQGIFGNITTDSTIAAGLNINSVDSVYFYNIKISNATQIPQSNVIFVDNRTSHDYPFSPARALFMENVQVLGPKLGTPKPLAINVNDGTPSGGCNPTPLAALAGKIYNFTYDTSQYSVTDTKNTWYGSSKPGSLPWAPDSTTEQQYVYYDDATRDVMGGKKAVSPIQLRPLAPINFGGNATYPASVVLIWDTAKHNGNSAITAQKLYKATGNGSYTLYQTLAPDATSYTDVGVTDGTTYKWVLTAVNANGESLKLNDFTLAYTTPPQPPTPTIPGAPANFATVGGNGFVNLSWDYPATDGYSEVTQYRIYRGATSSSLSQIASIGAQTTYTDNAVTNETTYYYAVSAVNAIGEGATTTPITGKPTAFTIPDPVTSITATPGGTSGHITVAWLEPSNTGGKPILSYEVWRSPNGTSGFTKIRTVAGTVFSIDDSGRTPATKYYYYVKAINEVGTSNAGTVVNATAP